MEPIYHRQRYAAAQEFQQSLNQLEDILQVDSTEDKAITEVNTSKDTSQTTTENAESIDLETGEDHVADIEQYSGQKTKKIIINQQVNTENLESIDIEELEDAIADIEQYLARKNEE